MKIALACDHGGLDLKHAIINYLKENGYEYEDFGTYSHESCDYPDYAKLAARAVVNRECDLGILVCGTGIGIGIAANKIKGVRCALCNDVFSAKATRAHNDANMMSIGQRVIGEGHALEIVAAFLNGKFEGDRHIQRIEKMMALEEE
ncbi:MAG: ribose 5-phosphate isomerase B [Erysipelotrichaceae bacterium]|nr:ribose 5-phosphate isomerase B [Erysipelotrichaceae bacterium]MDD3809043.1 ribose 5-phosphate isomerase B [Erysipelotrichaceae bacterium]